MNSQCNYSAKSGVERGFSSLSVKISVFPRARFARIAKLAYAQTVAMLMGSRSLKKNDEIFPKPLRKTTPAPS